MTQYEFRLSLRSNDPKVITTGNYLKASDDTRHKIFAAMVHSDYPIALCLDRSRTDREVLVAAIESLSYFSAQKSYITNFLRADRNIIITPEMLNNELDKNRDRFSRTRCLSSICVKSAEDGLYQLGFMQITPV
jgi:hypothetical protein